MHEHLVTIRPLALKVLFRIILGEVLLLDILIQERRGGRGVRLFAGQVRAFDLRRLDAADAVVIVVDGCLEDYFFRQPSLTSHLSLPFML